MGEELASILDQYLMGSMRYLVGSSAGKTQVGRSCHKRERSSTIPGLSDIHCCSKNIPHIKVLHLLAFP